jgi:hypothetical protein
MMQLRLKPRIEKNKLFFFLFIFSTFSQMANAQKIIEWKLDSTVTDSIYEHVFLNEFSAQYLGKNPTKTAWVEIMLNDNYLEMIFRKRYFVGITGNKELKSLIKKTNRYLILKNYKIPIIFPLDNEYIELRDKNILPLGGYLIRIGRNKKILLEGLLR